MEQKPVESKAMVKANQTGLLVGTTIDEQFRIATAYHKAKLLPVHYDSPEKILAAMQLCYELGLKPLTSMRQIAVINGAPSLWGELPLALVRSSGKLKEIREVLFDKTGKEINRENGNLNAEIDGAECTTVRIDKDGRETMKTTTFTVADAKFARLWGAKVWAVYPKRMIQMRTRSQNLKDNFPDVLMGVAIAEYDFNVDPQTQGSGEKEISTDKAIELKEKLKAASIDKTDAIDAEIVHAIELPPEPETIPAIETAQASQDPDFANFQEGLDLK